jgi:hypothetical protein
MDGSANGSRLSVCGDILVNERIKTAALRDAPLRAELFLLAAGVFFRLAGPGEIKGNAELIFMILLIENVFSVLDCVGAAEIILFFPLQKLFSIQLPT